jgi:hypothetical protein
MSRHVQTCTAGLTLKDSSSPCVALTSVLHPPLPTCLLTYGTYASICCYCTLRPAGAAGPVDASCSLLTNVTASLPQQLQLQPNKPWPAVLGNFSTSDKIQLRSIAWLCISSAAAWDAFGAATHELIHTGGASECECNNISYQQLRSTACLAVTC